MDRCQSFHDLPCELVCTLDISSFCGNAVPCTGGPSALPTRRLARFSVSTRGISRIPPLRLHCTSLVDSGSFEESSPSIVGVCWEFLWIVHMLFCKAHHKAASSAQGAVSVCHRQCPAIQQTSWPYLGFVHTRREWLLSTQLGRANPLPMAQTRGGSSFHSGAQGTAVHPRGTNPRSLNAELDSA